MIKNLIILIHKIFNVLLTILGFFWKLVYNTIILILIEFNDSLIFFFDFLLELNEFIIKSLYMTNSLLFNNLIPIDYIKQLNFSKILEESKILVKDITEKLEDMKM